MPIIIIMATEKVNMNDHVPLVHQLRIAIGVAVIQLLMLITTGPVPGPVMIMAQHVLVQQALLIHGPASMKKQGCMRKV